MNLTALLNLYTGYQLGLKRQSAEQLCYSIRSLEQFHGRTIDAAELCDALVLPWLRQRLRDCSPATAKRDRGNVLCLWRWGLIRGHCIHQPDIPSIKVPRRIPRYWTVEQVSAIVRTCRRLQGPWRDTGIRRADWWESLCLSLYDSGARLSALLAVRTCDLDVLAGWMRLDAETAKTGIEQLIRLSAQTTAAIRKHYRADRALVWPYPFNRRQVWPQLKIILSMAGLPADRYRMFYCFRRTTATLCAQLAGMETARRQLGHTSVDMTRRYIDETSLAGPQAADVLPRPSA